MLKFSYKQFYIVLAALFLSLSACNDDDESNTPAVPSTYNFENVDYSGQTERILMLDSLERKIKSANNGTTTLSAADLTGIYTNASGNLFGSSKNLSGKTETSAKPAIEAYLKAAADRSGNPDNLVGGRLMDENGHEIAQMVAKGLMGAVLYYQATTVYLGNEKMNVDNEKVEAGKGTAMQHHWDEAFGYFGAPKNYLSGEEGADKTYYWAKYADSRSSVVDVRKDIFNAFIEGRAAIGRKDYTKRNEAIATIKEKWELLIAANVVHYINESLGDLEANNQGDLYHHWSEAKAFANAFYFNIDKKISIVDYEKLQQLLGDTPKTITQKDLQDANILLQKVFGFTDSQMRSL